MTAADTIKSLVKLGVLINDAVSAKNTDWATFLKSADYGTIRSSVEGLAGQLGRGQIDGTIQAINHKQQALLAGRKIEELSTDELVQYSKLGNIKGKLLNSAADGSNLAVFGQWLLKDALPVLLDAAPIVIPLLL